MVRKILKSKRGISPILATFLLLIIAVAAVTVTYVWIMTFTSSTNRQAGAVLTVDNLRFYTISSIDYIEVILENSGTDDTKVKNTYVGITDSNLIPQSSISYTPTSQIVAANSFLNVTITFDWTDETMYYFKITTEEGITALFSREV